MSTVHTLTPNALAEAITGRPYISWSQVQSYLLCPRAFAFRYVEKAEPEFTPSTLLFGSALHEAISMHNEARLEGCDSRSAQSLREVVRDELHPTGPPIRYNDGEDLDSLIALAERMLSAFLDSEAAKAEDEAPIISIEESVTGSVDPDLPDVHGRVDLVQLSCNGAVITDYKSTRASWPRNKAEEQAGQLHLYGTLLANRIDEEGRIGGLRFITITKGKHPKVAHHPVNLDDNRLHATIEQIREVWRGIIAGVFPARPGWPCKSCPFQNQCPSAPPHKFPLNDCVGR